MKKYIYQLAFLWVIILFACKNSSEKDPILVEAFEIHKESVHIAARAVEAWEKLPASDSMRSEFNSVLQDWGENLAEVPGFHYHHDGLGHHHGRAPLKLFPDEMLLVQKEFRDSIKSIYQRILAHQTDMSQK